MAPLSEYLPSHHRMVLRKLNMLYYSKLGLASYNEDGVDVFAEDWDTLVLLDACRTDLFEPKNTLPGTLETRQSRGSSTIEFLHANCGDRDLGDIVYVTANPVYHYNRESIDASFHRVVNVWDEDGWDDEVKTVLPETTTAYARDAHEEFPNKRLVVHYIQPHYPFIDTSVEFDKKQLHDGGERELSFWAELNSGRLDVSQETLWDLYERNLERALPHVERLVDDVDGRTVVTADHGNMFGERAAPIPTREYGHPSRMYTPSLVEVPWLVLPADERRTIVAGETESASASVDQTTVKSRLENLGYVAE